MNATVRTILPPTYNIVVQSALNFEVGDVVEHETLGGKGIIVAINGGVTIVVMATSAYDGF